MQIYGLPTSIEDDQRSLVCWKASWYLHKRDWDVRITSIGLGTFPWWRTRFLWFQIVHKMVNMVCRKHISFCSMDLFRMMQFTIHCFVKQCRMFDIMISSMEPCHTALAKGQCKKRWDMVSLIITKQAFVMSWDASSNKVCKHWQTVMQNLPNIGDDLHRKLDLPKSLPNNRRNVMTKLVWSESALMMVDYSIGLTNRVFPWVRVFPKKLVKIALSFGYWNIEDFLGNGLLV